MSKRKPKGLIIWKPVTKVKRRENIHSGAEIYDVSTFSPELIYTVYGMFVKRYSGDNELCYLLKDDNGVLKPVIVSNFIIVEEGDEDTQLY